MHENAHKTEVNDEGEKQDTIDDSVPQRHRLYIAVYIVRFKIQTKDNNSNGKIEQYLVKQNENMTKHYERRIEVKYISCFEVKKSTIIV